MLASAGAQAGDSRFFSELNDIPLMPGLYELEQETAVFDKPEGRIVESAAASETQTPSKIKGFYESTLPQLGWVRSGPDSFVRDGEKLTLTVQPRGNIQVLHFSLRPAP